MIFRLGITGGIGSGKSTVCKVFKALGIPVFSADDEAHLITDTDPGLRKELNKIAGEDLYTSGILDRKKLASIIFNNDSLLTRVNSLVHPLILNKFDRWSGEQDGPYVIMEAAVLFEAGAEKRVDKVLVVTAPLDERVKRVMERNKMSYSQVMERVKNQRPEEEMIKRSDYTVDNSDNSMIIPQVMDIHNRIMQYLNK